jgi:hypothetical protein
VPAAGQARLDDVQQPLQRGQEHPSDQQAKETIMTRRQPRPSFATLERSVLLAICDYLEGDGHGIYYGQFLREIGVPETHIASVTYRHTSDGTHKGSIYAPASSGMPGTPVLDHLDGVAALDLYRTIASDLGLPGSHFGGRGSEARDLDRRIRERLTPTPEEVAQVDAQMAADQAALDYWKTEPRSGR